MKPIALLFNGVWSQYIFAKAPKYRDFYRLVYTYQLSSETLDGCASLVIPFQSNHHEISRRRAVIERFLAEGKTVVCFGNAHRDWIDPSPGLLAYPRDLHPTPGRHPGTATQRARRSGDLANPGARRPAAGQHPGPHSRARRATDWPPGPLLRQPHRLAQRHPALTGKTEYRPGWLEANSLKPCTSF